MVASKSRKSLFEPKEKKLLKALGRRIGEYAAKNQVSIERLAYEAGVSKGYLYDIAKGQANPSVIILKRVSDCLDISLSELLQ